MSTWVVALFCLLLATPLFGQVPSPPNRVDLFIQSTDPNVSFDPATSSGISPYAEDTALVTVVIELNSTSGTDSIKVKLGNSSGGSQYLDAHFAFDDYGPYTGGMSYKREGNIVYLCLGQYYGIDSLYGEVKLSNTSGNSSAGTASFVP